MSMDPNGQSDPYCIIGLANNEINSFLDPSSVLRSKTHFVTLNPIWKDFSLIIKSTEQKVRVEVWDKDQDVQDDFEGMVMLDINALLEGDVTEKWISLVGRTDDEKVTGEVNVVITKGQAQELRTPRTRSLSISQSQELEKPNPQDPQRVIKKLTSDLKTKSGRLDMMKETTLYLDQTVVKLKQQVEALQGELASKSGILESKEESLTRANAYALELQKSLQEQQKVEKRAKEWNEKAKVLEQMQITLKAKSMQHKKKGRERE